MLNYKKFIFSNIIISKYRNNNLTFIIPYWTDLSEGQYDLCDNDWVEKKNNKITNVILKHHCCDSIDIFLECCLSFEDLYNISIKENIPYKDIQHLLPLSIESSMFITGYISDWKTFLNILMNKDNNFVKIFTSLQFYLNNYL